MSFLFVLFLMFPASKGIGQGHNQCRCVGEMMRESKVSTIFNFSNSKQIALCANDMNKEQGTYSEFALNVCGADTIIDFWGALENCKLAMQGDTLVVSSIELLANGTKYALTPQVWCNEYIYFRSGGLMRVLRVNRNISKYSQAQIADVLNQYEKAPLKLSDSAMEILERLFMASISGSKTARNYFIGFEKKFGKTDGGFAEEYHDLLAMLELWDQPQQ